MKTGWRTFLSIAIYCCALLSLGGCAPGTVTPPTQAFHPTATRAASSFEEVPCRVEAPASMEMRCGWVTVPESHNRPADARHVIKLAVAVLRAKGATPGSDPIFLLAGGPGDGAIDSQLATYLKEEKISRGEPVELSSPDLAETLRQHQLSYQAHLDLLRRHEYVLIDQRGTGRSQPSLDCRNREDLPGCYRRLKQAGIDLSAYNTRENAADIDAVRQALGYEKMNLYGGSYGTRLGFEVLRSFPDSVRSAVLDGVSPLNIDFEVEVVRRFDRTVGIVFEACRADPGCNAAYPDLKERFYRTVRQLNQSPVRLDLQPGEMEFDGDTLAQIVWHGMYYRESLPYLPVLIQNASEGRFDVARNFVKGMAGVLEDNHEGMRFSVLCAEQTTSQTVEQLAQAARTLRPEVKEGVAREWANLFQACEVWPVRKADAAYRQPVKSDVPVLLSSGEFDPATPPDFAHQVARSLTRVYDLTFPGIGHINQFESACKTRIQADFFDHPDQKPDTTCLAEMGLKFALPEPAP